jgi:hypothetical protein
LAERHLIAPAEFAGDVAHFWEDDGEGGGLVHSVQDVAPILERNKALYVANDGYSPSRELRRVAFIPNIVRQKWLNEEGWDAYRPDLYGDRLVAKLNDPEWRFLRTAPGRLGLANGKIR